MITPLQFSLDNGARPPTPGEDKKILTGLHFSCVMQSGSSVFTFSVDSLSREPPAKRVQCLAAGSAVLRGDEGYPAPFKGCIFDPVDSLMSIRSPGVPPGNLLTLADVPWLLSDSRPGYACLTVTLVRGPVLCPPRA